MERGEQCTVQLDENISVWLFVLHLAREVLHLPRKVLHLAARGEIALFFTLVCWAALEQLNKVIENVFHILVDVWNMKISNYIVCTTLPKCPYCRSTVERSVQDGGGEKVSGQQEWLVRGRYGTTTTTSHTSPLQSTTF